MADELPESHYSFLANWYDPVAELTRKFQVIFHESDGTVEMYDLVKKKLFLKRQKCGDMCVDDFHIGRLVTIFSRQLLLTGFADKSTESKFLKRTQRTLAVLSQDSLNHIGTVFRLIEDNGLKIYKAHLISLSEGEVAQFVAFHNKDYDGEKPIQCLKSGPICALELAGSKSLEKWQALVSGDAQACGSGSEISLEDCFGSTTQEEAEEELQFMFPCDFARNSSTKGAGSAIIKDIEACGYQISGLKMFCLSRPMVLELFEVYNEVLAEYKNMVCEMISGLCIALEVSSESSTDIVKKFRTFAGPLDPVVAKQLRPGTLRAKYGLNRIRNAVHCTDLPEDAFSELEYIFKTLKQVPF